MISSFGLPVLANAQTFVNTTTYRVLRFFFSRYAIAVLFTNLRTLRRNRNDKLKFKAENAIVTNEQTNKRKRKEGRKKNLPYYMYTTVQLQVVRVNGIT